MRAEALSRKPGHAGAIAFSRTGDPSSGDFSDARLIRKLRAGRSKHPMKLDRIRNEIARMRGQLRAQERQIQMLQRAGVATASAEILRMRAKVDDLCRERDASRKAESEVERRTGSCDLLRVGKRKVNDSVHQIAEIRGLTFAHGLFKGGLRAPPCGQGSGMRSVTQLCDGNDPFPPVSFAD